MAELSRFFNSTETDPREYPAADLCEVLDNIISTGIVKGLGQALEVTPSGQGLSVNVAPGIAFIKGYWYTNTETKTIQLDPVDGARTDLIIIRLDNDTGDNSKKITVEKKNGDLIQTDVCYELIVAEVNLQTGQSLISANDIIDKRGSAGSNYCPYATIPAIAELLLTTAEKSELTGGQNTNLHQHAIYALASHNHDSSYSGVNHNHNALYAPLSHVNTANIHTKITHGTILPATLENGEIFIWY